MIMRPIAIIAVAASMMTAALAEEPSSAPAPGTARLGIVTTQPSDQWLASKLIGTAVYNSANADEKVGSVDDLLLDSKGMPVAVVISAGGFLGIGGKKTTIDLGALQLVRSDDGDKVVAPVTKDQIKTAATFTPYKPPAPMPPTASRAPMGQPPIGAPPSRP